MASRIFLIAILFVPLLSTSQQQAAIWYFGDRAGLDFTTGVPIVLNDGALDTLEGCATISDAMGNLLFYTDGSTIWGSNHIPMPNGAGLLGDSSSSQSAIIVPAPDNVDIYYVFTVTFQAYPEGANYSVVDMSLNGGLGDVVTKNVALFAPAAEKLTAVQHAMVPTIGSLPTTGAMIRFWPIWSQRVG